MLVKKLMLLNNFNFTLTRTYAVEEVELEQHLEYLSKNNQFSKVGEEINWEEADR